MNSKEDIINSIKKWVKLDNEMRTLRQELSKRRKDKEMLSDQLIQTMKNDNIDSFDINTGKIEFVKRKTKKPISKKNLFEILSKYYNGDSNKINELNNYILDNREITLKDLLIHKLN